MKYVNVIFTEIDENEAVAWATPFIGVETSEHIYCVPAKKNVPDCILLLSPDAAPICNDVRYAYKDATGGRTRTLEFSESDYIGWFFNYSKILEKIGAKRLTRKDVEPDISHGLDVALKSYRKAMEKFMVRKN